MISTNVFVPTSLVNILCAKATIVANDKVSKCLHKGKVRSKWTYSTLNETLHAIQTLQKKVLEAMLQEAIRINKCIVLLLE